MKRNFLVALGLLVCLTFFVLPGRLCAQAAADTDELPGAAAVADEVMADVFARFEEPLPKAADSQKPIADGKTGKEAAKAETAEEKAAREAAANETPEQKAEREAAEAAEAEKLANETAEEKAAREEREKLLANETPEEKTVREAKEAAEAAANTIEFTEEQVAYLEEQVAVKTAEFNAKLSAAETKVAELTAQLQTASAKPGPVPANIPAVFMVDSMDKIVEEQTRLNTFKDWALEHWDGFEATKEGEKSFTKEQIRSAYAGVEKQLTQVLPAAAQTLRAREQYEPQVKLAYPELMDPKTPEFKVMMTFLNAAPNLRLFPNFKLLIGDAIAGEKARLAKNKSKSVIAPSGKKVVTVVKKLAPKLPVGARSGPQSQAALEQRRASMAKAQKGVADVKGFVAGGASHASLVDTVAKML